MQAADLWCNLVQGGRASHTKRQKDQQRPLVSCSARQQTLSTTTKRTELEWTKQVNNEMWTDLILYLVRMMMVVAVLFLLYAKNESNYAIINNNRHSGDAKLFYPLGNITWQPDMWNLLYKADIFCLKAGIFAGDKLVCLLCGTTASEGKSVKYSCHTWSREMSCHHGIQKMAHPFSQSFLWGIHGVAPMVVVHTTSDNSSFYVFVKGLEKEVRSLPTFRPPHSCPATSRGTKQEASWRLKYYLGCYLK